MTKIVCEAIKKINPGFDNALPFIFFQQWLDNCASICERVANIGH